MNIGRSLYTFEIAETYFKPVDGGYLFQTPSPWLFAPGRRYFVSEDQKLALLDIMRQRHQGERIALVSAAIIAFPCGVGVLWWAISSRHDPGMLDVLGITVTALMPLYAVSIVSLRRYLHRIEPIVSAAVPTRARFSLGERFRAIGDAMPTRFLVAGAVIWSLTTVTDLISILNRSGGQPLLSGPGPFPPIFQAVTSLAFALFFLYAMCRRFRRTV